MDAGGDPQIQQDLDEAYRTLMLPQTFQELDRLVNDDSARADDDARGEDSANLGLIAEATLPITLNERRTGTDRDCCGLHCTIS